MADESAKPVVPKAINYESPETTFDIIAVPAIGADPATTWAFSKTRASNTQTSIYSDLPLARVYLYTHPPPNPRIQHGVAFYARSLLEYVVKLPDLGGRPLSFAGYSTGGLVVKRALNLASLSLERQSCSDLVRRCFSVSFFGVPHYGSTILSEDLHMDNVASVLSLKFPLSNLLRQELSSDNLDELERSSQDFAAFSIQLKRIWSFVEGQETTLTLRDSKDAVLSASLPTASRVTKHRTTTFFRTPIVDRRSATLSTTELQFGVEEVTEIDSTHALLATFGDSSQSSTFKKYIEELSTLAHGLSSKETKDLERLSKTTFTDVHLFYEGGQKGMKPFVKLWSEFPALFDLCEKGPAKCLERRLNSLSRTASVPVEPELFPKSFSVAPPVVNAPAVPEISIEMVEDDAVDAASLESKTTSDPATKKEQDTTTEAPREPRPTQPITRTKGVFSATKGGSGARKVRKRSTSADSDGDANGAKDSPPEPGIKRKDTYDEFIRDFEEYYDEAPVSPTDFFIPEEMKNESSASSPSGFATIAETEHPRRGSLGYDEHRELTTSSDLLSRDRDLYYLLLKQERDTKLLQGFILPSLERIKFRWIHIPANNMIWVPAVFQALATESKQPSLQRTLLHRQLWNALQHIPRHSSPHGRFMTPSCNATFPEAPTATRSISSGLPSPIDAIQMSLFFPYLHWDTFGDLKARRQLVERRSRQERPYPVEKSVVNNCLEHQLMWYYLHNASELPIHIRRSLDQYGYPNLSNTKARDMDQILYKRTRTRDKTSENVKSHIAEMWDEERKKAGHKIHWHYAKQSKQADDDRSRVLMVDTLWLWIVDEHSVMSFFPSRRHGQRKADDTTYGTADVHDKIYNDVNGDPRFARQCHDCFDFAALAILHSATALLETHDDRDLQVFRIFEEYLSVLTEQQTKSFKSFRDSQLGADGPEDEKFIRRMLSNLHNREDLTALLELRDISDELKTLDKLFTEQVKVIDQMLGIYKRVDKYNKDKAQPHRKEQLSQGEKPPKPQYAYTHEQASKWLRDAKTFIQGYSEQSKDMQGRCESIQEAYKLLLDMKQKQANIAEASLSRLSAQVASEQNRAIMIFTIFTIIFLPLSFFTSLFGMNVQEWSGQSNNPKFHEVFLIAGCISAGIIIAALLLAFNKPIRQRVVRFFHRSLKHWPSKGAKFVYKKIFEPCFGSRANLNRGPRDLEEEMEASWISKTSTLNSVTAEKFIAGGKAKSNTD